MSEIIILLAALFVIPTTAAEIMRAQGKKADYISIAVFLSLSLAMVLGAMLYV